MKVLSTLLLCFGMFLSVQAQKPELVKDINDVASSTPASFIDYNGLVYFVANDDDHGFELWSTDGTEAGTTLVKDINPGVNSSSPYAFHIFNGLLYFSADDGSNGQEMWVSDGTEAGTQLLKDIFSGNDGSDIGGFTEFNGKLYFRAKSADGATQLWVSDGSTLGTVELKEINTTGSSTPLFFVILSNQLYFSAYDGSTRELWTTDGTALGTQAVTSIGDIQAGGAVVSNLYVNNGLIYFIATEDASGTELWSSDGSTIGTTLLKDINPGVGGSNPGQFTAIGNNVYFTATNVNTGNELWVTDGTTSGTVLLKDIDSGSSGSFASDLFEWNGRIYFSADDATNGNELWVTDGSSAGTEMLIDLNPTGNSLPSKFMVLDNQLYFRAAATNGDGQLYRTDGTIGNAELLQPTVAPNFNPFAEGYVSSTFNAIFMNCNYTSLGSELYIFRGSPVGTHEPSSDLTISVYPNPASNTVTIEGGNLEYLSLSNLIGQEVLSHPLTTLNNINIEALQAGVYIYTTRSSDGNTTSGKLLVE